MKKLKGGYFGTRGPEMFSKYFLSKVERHGGAFIDITAGTGQFPYHLATEKGLSVGLVERCPYVGYLLQAVFTERTLDKPRWSGRLEAEEVVDIAFGKKRIGYLAGLRTTDRKVYDAFGKQTAMTIDSVMACNQNNPLVLHCMARAIGRLFLYRGVNISRTTPKGGKTKDVGPLEVIDLAKRTYDRMMALRIENADHWVHVGDSTEVIRKIPKRVIQDAIVYADPAWPYAKQFGSSNPYKIAYEFLSSIMLQRQLTLNKVWEIDKLDQIHSDVATWINVAFDRGASMFILCSQDTNFPSEQELKQWVKTRWHIAKHERSDDFSSFANRKYVTYWFYLTGPR